MDAWADARFVRDARLVRCPGLDNPKVPCRCLEACTLAVHSAATSAVRPLVSSPCNPVGWEKYPPLHAPASCSAHLSARPATPWPLWGCASNCRGCAAWPPPKWGALARWPGCHSSRRAACPASGMVGGRVAPPDCFGVSQLTASSQGVLQPSIASQELGCGGQRRRNSPAGPCVPEHHPLHHHSVVSTGAKIHVLHSDVCSVAHLQHHIGIRQEGLRAAEALHVHVEVQPADCVHDEVPYLQQRKQG